MAHEAVGNLGDMLKEFTKSVRSTCDAIDAMIDDPEAHEHPVLDIIENLKEIGNCSNVNALKIMDMLRKAVHEVHAERRAYTERIAKLN